MPGIQRREYVRNMDDSKYDEIALIHHNGKAMAVYKWMAHSMGKNNALIVSVDVLCAFFKCDRRTMERHIRYLKENKLIAIGKTGASNIYFINSKVYRWDSTTPVYKLSASVVIADDKAKELSRRIKKLEREYSDEINTRKNPEF